MIFANCILFLYFSLVVFTAEIADFSSTKCSLVTAAHISMDLIVLD